MDLKDRHSRIFISRLLITIKQPWPTIRHLWPCFKIQYLVIKTVWVIFIILWSRNWIQLIPFYKTNYSKNAFFCSKLFESFQQVTINRYENYSTAILGKINILLTAPHGGWDRPNMIAKRTKLFCRKLAMRFEYKRNNTFNQRKFAAIAQIKTKHWCLTIFWL